MRNIQYDIGYLKGKMFAKNSSIVLVCLLAMSFWQCEGDIELDYSDFRPKLVVNAQMSADSRFVIAVTSSTTPVTQGGGQMPEGVLVTLLDLSTNDYIDLYRENNLFITTPDISVKPGNEYLLKAEAPGYDAIEATTTIPGNVDIDDLFVKDFILVPSEVTPDKKNVSYSIQLDYPEGSRDFLHILFEQKSRIRDGSAANPVYEDVSFPILPEFPEEAGFFRHIEDGILVSLADADTNPIDFDFKNYTIGAIDEELGNVIVEIRTVSPEYYHYFVSLTKQRITLQDPFAEPVPVFSNVTGGLGNFSGFSSVIYEISLF